MSFQKQLQAMRGNWKEGLERGKEMFGAEDLQDGVYEAKLMKCGLKEVNAKMFVERQFALAGPGENAGIQVSDLMFIEHPVGIAYLNRWIEMNGYEAPSDPEQLPEFFEAIQGEHALCKLKTKRDDEGRIKLTVIQILSTNIGEEDIYPKMNDRGEGEAREKAADAEENDFRKTSSPIEDKALRSRIIAFCQSQGVEMDPKKDSIDSLKEKITANSYPEETLDATEIELLTEIGLEGDIVRKPKAEVKKPLAKTTATSAPVGKVNPLKKKI